MRNSTAIGSLLVIGAFAAAPASAQEFEFIQRETRNGNSGTRVRIYAHGGIEVSKGVLGQSSRTLATPTERKMIERGVRNARLRELPDDQLSPGPHTFRLTLCVGNVLKRYHGGSLSPIMRRRIRTLWSQLDRIEKRALEEAPFTRFSRRVVSEPQPGGATTQVAFVLSIEGSGAVRLSRTPRLRYPVSGQLTPQELTTLREAHVNAKIRSIPYHTKKTKGVSRYGFRIEDPMNGLTKFSGDVGRYGHYSRRLRPLMAILDAIQERLLQELRNAKERVTGEIRIQGPEVYLYTTTHQTFRVVDGAFSKQLATFEGGTVTLEGVVDLLDSSRIGFEPTGWIDPVRKDITGKVTLNRDTTHVLLKDGYRQKEATGKAAKVLTKLEGREVRLDAWVWEGYRAHVNAVYARAESDIGNVAKTGEQVLITRISKSGTSLLVKHPLNGSGRAKLSQVAFEARSNVGLAGRLAGIR